MKYRETELLDRTDVGRSGTESIPINVRDPISRIDITFMPKAMGLMGAQIAACITKIELTDGSDVLFSMSGLEAQGLNIYDRRCPTMNSHYFNRGNYVHATMGIDFGRWLWDPELALVPDKFNNLMLKITYNERGAYAATDDNYLEVFAHCFDEKVISPVGFLMSKLHYAYDPLGDEKYNYVQLPTDYTYRQMLVRGYKTKVDPLNVVDEARLSEENDKRVVFDIELRRYFYRMQGVWKEIEECWNEYAKPLDADNDMWFTPTNYGTVVVEMPEGAGTDVWTVVPMQGGWMDWRGTPGFMHYGRVTGFLPNHCIQLPFGIPSDLDSWYDAQLKKSIQLRLLSASEGDGSLISVILQQLRTY